jgi:hypothetical protein
MVVIQPAAASAVPEMQSSMHSGVMCCRPATHRDQSAARARAAPLFRAWLASRTRRVCDRPPTGAHRSCGPAPALVSRPSTVRPNIAAETSTRCIWRSQGTSTGPSACRTLSLPTSENLVLPRCCDSAPASSPRGTAQSPAARKTRAVPMGCRPRRRHHCENPHPGRLTTGQGRHLPGLWAPGEGWVS